MQIQVLPSPAVVASRMLNPAFGRGRARRPRRILKLAAGCLGAVLVALTVGLTSRSASADGGSFEPVWRLLTREQKQQFVAGYLNGMRDAAKMTDLLQDIVKQNPESASGSLDRLAQIYQGVGRSSPDSIVAGIESFYADPANSGAQLSAAITAAQQKSEQAALK